MKSTQLNIKASLFLITVLTLLASCSDDEDDFTTNRDISSDLVFTISADSKPGDTIFVETDIDTELSDIVTTIANQNQGAELKSLEVVSVLIISSDVSEIAYLDSMAMFLESSSPEDNLNLEIPPSAELISTAGPDKLGQSSFTMNLESTNVTSKLNNTDFYDMYFQAFLNEEILDIVQDRLIEVQITFRAVISNS